MDLDGVADELYGLPLADFVATRNARAKQARAAGERDVAAAITAMTKPTKVAWLANQLVRQRGDQVTPLLELGAALREATASLSGDDLRALTRQQFQLVHALVQQAKSLAGEPVSDDVADGLDRTLRAALADATLADQLQQARLVEGLEFTGFGGSAPVGTGRPQLTVVSDPPKSGKGSASAKSAKSDEAAQRQRLERERAERAVIEARAALATAESDRDTARKAADDSAAGTQRLAERVDRLRAELDDAVVEHAGAEKAARAARTAAERAEQKARAAARRVTVAEQAVDALR